MRMRAMLVLVCLLACLGLGEAQSLQDKWKGSFQTCNGTPCVYVTEAVSTGPWTGGGSVNDLLFYSFDTCSGSPCLRVTGGTSAAPADATYIVQTASSGLSAEQSLGALTTGILLNTVTSATGVLSTYAAQACTNQFVRGLSASAAPTCASVANTDIAAMTSAQLAGILSDETGTGAAVFGTSPSFTTSIIVGSGDGGTPAAGAIRGPIAAGVDVNGATLTIDPAFGTGTGTIGLINLRGALNKQLTGSTAQTIGTYLRIGAVQTTHPGTSGFFTTGPANTVTDEVTAQDATAGLDSAHSFLGKTFAARNTGVTTTDVTTLYVTPSLAGTNNTATNAYSAIFTGAIRSDGVVKLPGLASSSAATTGTLCWTTGTGNVNVDTTTTCLLSTRRVKKHIKPLNEALPSIMAMKPVSYDLKNDPLHTAHQVGLIAEEVYAVDKRLVSLDKDHQPLGVRYQQLTAVLVKALQEQQAEILSLRQRLDRLEGR